MNDKRLPIKGRQFDHPEHFRDRIEMYSSEGKYIPEQLQDLLLEQCGHRCSVCSEPIFEFHHIVYLEDGGKTEYENLIVLCPNCHTRVHRNNIPNKKQLKQYKLKQEVSYGLPIIGHLSKKEKEFISRLSKEKEDELVLFVENHQEKMMVDDDEEAQRRLRKKVGLLYLEAEGIIRTEYGSRLRLTDGSAVVSLGIRMTDKGIRWLRYLKSAGILDLFLTQE